MASLVQVHSNNQLIDFRLIDVTYDWLSNEVVASLINDLIELFHQLKSWFES